MTGSGRTAAADAVVLVAQNGSLFGIPAAQLTFEAATDSTMTAALAAGQQCQVPPVDQLVQEQQLHGRDVIGHARALVAVPGPGQQGNDGAQSTSQQCKPAHAEPGVCAVATLGLYVVQPSSNRVLLLPPSANEAAAQREQQQQGSTGSYVGLGWLAMLVVGAALGAGIAAALLPSGVWQKTALAATAAAASTAANGQHQPSNTGKMDGAGLTAEAAVSSKGRRRGGNGGKKQQQHPMSNRLKGLVQQMAVEESAAEIKAATSRAATTALMQQPPPPMAQAGNELSWIPERKPEDLAQRWGGEGGGQGRGRGPARDCMSGGRGWPGQLHGLLWWLQSSQTVCLWARVPV